MEVYNVSTQIMDLFSSSYVYQMQKNQERKLGTRILLLFLQFKAWYVFQTYIENNWTICRHSWPSWSWSETFRECQLIKQKKSNYMLEFFFIFAYQKNKKKEIEVHCICMIDQCHKSKVRWIRMYTSILDAAPFYTSLSIKSTQGKRKLYR